MQSKDLIDNNGSWLLTKYRNSTVSVVINVLDNFPYKPWLFVQAPKRFFHEKKNRKIYLEWLKEKVKVAKLSDLKVSHFRNNGGGGFLGIYKNSISLVLESVDEDSGNLVRKLVTSWSIENQREFLDSIGKLLGIEKGSMEKWYLVKQQKVIDLGGDGLLTKHYSNSLYKMLLNVYPEIDWVPWKFLKLPKIVGRDPKLIKRAVNEMETQLGIKNPSEWTRVNKADLVGLEAFKVIRNCGGLESVLQKAYPEISWKNLEPRNPEKVPR